MSSEDLKALFSSSELASIKQQCFLWKLCCGWKLSTLMNIYSWCTLFPMQEDRPWERHSHLCGLEKETILSTTLLTWWNMEALPDLVKVKLFVSLSLSGIWVKQGIVAAVSGAEDPFAVQHLCRVHLLDLDLCTTSCRSRLWEAVKKGRAGRNLSLGTSQD